MITCVSSVDMVFMDNKTNLDKEESALTRFMLPHLKICEGGGASEVFSTRSNAYSKSIIVACTLLYLCGRIFLQRITNVLLWF